MILLLQFITPIAWVAKLVDAADLKSADPYNGRAGSIPALGTILNT